MAQIERFSSLVRASRIVSRAFQLVCKEPDRFKAGRDFIERRFSHEGILAAARELIQQLEGFDDAETRKRVDNHRSILDEKYDDLMVFFAVTDWLDEKGPGMLDAEAEAVLLVTAWMYDHGAAENVSLPPLLRSAKFYPALFDITPDFAEKTAMHAAIAMDRVAAMRVATRAPVTSEASAPVARRDEFHDGHRNVAELLIWASKAFPNITANKPLFALWPQWPDGRGRKRPKYSTFKRYRSALKGMSSKDVPADDGA